jgi:catechol 2,3-dioxygenase-like lactoylglutathione lyase family enzyme
LDRAKGVWQELGYLLPFPPMAGDMMDGGQADRNEYQDRPDRGCEGFLQRYPGDERGHGSRMDHDICDRRANHTADQHRDRGRGGAPVPDISVEVDNIDEVHQRTVVAGFRIEYGPTNESWGVRRFYVRDPFGRLVNILAHV